MENKALATVDQDVYLVFDRLDDQQIVAEMKGATLTEYVYEFTSGGKTVRGLSKAGTDDATRFMAVNYGEVLRELDVTLELQDEDAAYFKATAARYRLMKDGTSIELDRVIGQKRQPKFGTSRDGKRYPNEFWYEQGGQKALRNAKQKLIPEPIKQKLLAEYVEAGKVRRVVEKPPCATEPTLVDVAGEAVVETKFPKPYATAPPPLPVERQELIIEYNAAKRAMESRGIEFKPPRRDISNADLVEFTGGLREKVRMWDDDAKAKAAYQAAEDQKPVEAEEALVGVS